MPRPSSPLDAKASVRSPYALDRSQQNSCVGTKNAGRPYEGPFGAHTCALVLSLQTMMSSRIHPRAQGAPDRPFNSRCQICRRGRGRDGNLSSAIAPVWWSAFSGKAGGARRVRTDDLMLAKHALYQLSYGPNHLWPGSGELVVDPSVRPRCHTKCGGPRQTRTADLTLIRRVL